MFKNNKILTYICMEQIKKKINLRNYLQNVKKINKKEIRKSGKIFKNKFQDQCQKEIKMFYLIVIF